MAGAVAWLTAVRVASRRRLDKAVLVMLRSRFHCFLSMYAMRVHAIRVSELWNGKEGVLCPSANLATRQAQKKYHFLLHPEMRTAWSYDTKRFCAKTACYSRPTTCGWNTSKPRYVTKTWEVMYKGHVLVSAPRKAALAKDAVLTKFPGCLAHFIKTEKKKRKAPVDHSLSPAIKLHCEKLEKCNNVSGTKVNRHFTGMWSDQRDGSQKLRAIWCYSIRHNASRNVSNKFGRKSFWECQYRASPSTAWVCHRVDADGLRAIIFCEVCMISAAASQPDCPASGACYNHYAAAPSLVIVKRVVSVHEQLNISVTLLGKRILLEWI